MSTRGTEPRAGTALACSSMPVHRGGVGGVGGSGPRGTAYVVFDRRATVWIRRWAVGEDELARVETVRTPCAGTRGEGAARRSSWSSSRSVPPSRGGRRALGLWQQLHLDAPASMNTRGTEPRAGTVLACSSMPVHRGGAVLGARRTSRRTGCQDKQLVQQPIGATVARWMAGAGPLDSMAASRCTGVDGHARDRPSCERTVPRVLVDASASDIIFDRRATAWIRCAGRSGRTTRAGVLAVGASGHLRLETVAGIRYDIAIYI